MKHIIQLWPERSQDLLGQQSMIVGHYLLINYVLINAEVLV